MISITIVLANDHQVWTDHLGKKTTTWFPKEARKNDCLQYL